MSALDFTTAMENAEARSKKGSKTDIAVRLDGRKMKVKRPTPAKFMLAQSALKRNDMGYFLDFMLGLFRDKDDQAHLLSRLEDDDDPFDIFSEDEEEVTLYRILEAVMSEMSARPTSSPSDSAPSQSPSGQTSTGGARVKAKRRATSRSTGS